MTSRCIVLLGGSFDPVHIGHVALGNYFVRLLMPDELRIVPAGNPWQKQGLQASPSQRVDMLRLAFERQPETVRMVIDEQEIHRASATYTIDTLKALRTELGWDVSLVFLLGADQLQQLHTWGDWQQLFDYAHLCAASRPGFSLDALEPDVAREFSRRLATPDQIRNTPHGLAYVAKNLAVDVSATQIRAALERGEDALSLLPPGVLDYLEQHHLYQS